MLTWNRPGRTPHGGMSPNSAGPTVEVEPAFYTNRVIRLFGGILLPGASGPAEYPDPEENHRPNADPEWGDAEGHGSPCETGNHDNEAEQIKAERHGRLLMSTAQHPPLCRS